MLSPQNSPLLTKITLSSISYHIRFFASSMCRVLVVVILSVRCLFIECVFDPVLFTFFTRSLETQVTNQLNHRRFAMSDTSTGGPRKTVDAESFKAITSGSGCRFNSTAIHIYIISTNWRDKKQKVTPSKYLR